MASGRDKDHFALDWIKSDLLETLNQARVALDEYAEQGADETRLRACLTHLHQLHGTLLMLELKGITLLADHLERLAQALLAGDALSGEGGSPGHSANQVLMQGILEIPGFLDELQRGAEDDTAAFIPLVNDIRTLLGDAPLEDRAGGSLNAGADDRIVARFEELRGQEKVARIRSAYQNVLLSILKGEERSSAVATLAKIAEGLQRLTRGASMERQWEAFGEFVASLSQREGALEPGAVKLLRRVDLEIKSLATDGAVALKKPVNLTLVQELLAATDAENYESETVTGLKAAVDRESSNNTLAISGRQALATAAIALRDELSVIKDKLDLLARAGSLDLNALEGLSAPLNQIGSTLSLLGFESSREIIADQVKAIDNVVMLGDSDTTVIQSIASALMQIDENLNSVSTEKSEIEQITGDAQLQLLREARKGLEKVKASVVDFVTAHWDTGHLADVPDTFREICGALDIVPLPRVTVLLNRVNDYVESSLLKGHRPDWEELDKFADAVSGVDYFLERLAEENTGGMEDILHLAERSVADIAAVPAAQDPRDAEPAFDEQALAFGSELAEEAAEPSIDAEAQLSEAQAPEPMDSPIVDEPEPESEVEAAEVVGAIDAPEEITLALDEDADFDLSSDMFDEVPGVIGPSDAPAPTIALEEDEADAAAPEPVIEEVAEADAAAAAPIAAALEGADALPEPDPEIVEIFVEEVDEVLENVDQHLPQWATSLTDEDALTELRRAFHTLKGSGRIVQAVALGELAWSIENMLNRVIDGTVESNDQFVGVVTEARNLIPTLKDDFERRQPSDLEAISVIIERADVLSSGGALETVAAATTDAPVIEDSVAEEATEEAEAPVEAPAEALAPEPDGAALDATAAVDEEAEPAPSAETVEPAAELEAEAAEAASDAVAEDDFVDLDDVLADFHGGDEAVAEPADLVAVDADFLAEARECAQAMSFALEATPFELSESLMRACHTLSGSAGTAGVEPVRFIAEPANQVVEAFRGQTASDEVAAFFRQTLNALESCLDHLDGGRIEDWEDPVELVAAADDLIVASQARQSPIEALLESDATGALYQLEAELPLALRGERESTGFISALSDVLGLAGAAEVAPVADMTAALLRGFNQAQTQGRVHQEAQDVITQAYDALLDQLNSLVTGQTAPAHTNELAALEELDFSGDEPAATAETEDDACEAMADLAADLESSTAEEGPTPVGEVLASIADLDIDPDLVDVFFEEAEEINEELEHSIVTWSGERDNRLHLENLLRGLHTLKGGARLCGLVDVGDMTHDFETTLITVQNGEHAVDDDLFKELNERFDAIVGRLSEVKTALKDGPAPTPEAAESEASSERIELPSLEDLAHATEDSDAVAETSPSPVEAAASEPKIEAQPLEAAAARPQALAKRDAPERPERVERPQQEMVRVGATLLEDLVNLAGENSILRARIEQGMSDFTSALDEMETTIDRLREQLRRLEIETETQILYRHEREDGPQYDNFDPLEMDRYSQLQQLSRGLSESASDMLDLKDTLLYKARESETLLLQQARINTELQEGLMRTRMVPFNRLLPRLRRIVRQVAGELGKEVDFHVQNAEGELDRNLLERMVPPLEHMLRNAVDHGIETQEVRRNFGKAATGRVDLRLSREGGDVVIEISDDGAGIDVETVRAKAIERGLCAPNAVLSDDDVMQFVLAPGFSTAKSVTQISGRGVGMDVVHSEVKQLGGSITISSRVGQGTRFVVRVPFTVSVNRALMVSVNDDLYALPLNTIEGIVLLSPEQLENLHSDDSATFEYAGVPYRVRYLGQYLGREFRGTQVGQTSVPLVLVRSGDHAVAIHVDAVQGSREIVVKSLGPQFAGVGGISGATILGDGNVVVILDLHALIRAQRNQLVERVASTASLAGRPRCVLVVDDSVTVRKVTSRLLERQGMDVLVAKDGVEAVALLQERRPDVMLLDIEMPRMDGFEVARQVRHDDRLLSLPIIMISSRTGDKHKEHANQLGVNKFLGKPFQENELLSTIDELVST